MSDFGIEDLLEQLPDLIDSAIRANEMRPPAAEHGLASIKTGVAVSADSLAAQVVFDDDDPEDPPHTIQAATAINPGDRVVVLTRAGGGAYAIGNGEAQTTGVQSVVAGTNVTVDDTDPQNPIVSAGAAGSGFPVGPLDDGNATSEIQVESVDLGGGFWETAMLQNVVDSSGFPVNEAKSLWFIGVVDDGSGGAQQLSQWESDASVASGNGTAKVYLAATRGNAGIESDVELLASTGNYLGFSGPAPIPHIKLISAFGSPTAPGTPLIGKILIESSAFGPVDILIGGAANDNLGFFNTTPVAQPAHPANITDVIALLTALGLCAP